MAPSSWHRGQQPQEHGDGVVDASLLARVQAHDAFFCEMVDLIPPELYLPKDEEEETNAKYYKNKRQAAPKQEKKEASKKGKRVKFDPANMKSVTQLQKERAEKEKEEKRRKAEAGGSSEEEDEEDEEEDGSESGSDESEGDEGMEVEEDEDEDEEEEDEEEEEKAASGVTPHKGEGESSSNGGGGQTKGGKAGRGPLSLAGTTPRAKSIDELRERLRLRIEEARARRGGASGGSKLEGKGQKQQAQQQGKKGGAGHHPQAKPPQHKGAPSVTAAQASPLGSGGAGRRPSEQALDIQFGKIAVPAQGPERLRLKKGGKNLVGLLQKAEEKERRLKELQASEEGKDQAQALLWKDALKSAHGEKVLDNPKLLKKAIKRKQKLKERSARKWDARKQAQEAAGRERQEKREANLKKRKAGPGGGAEAAAAGKDGPDGVKKQRRAGFEGKRHGHEFLNGGGGGGGKGPAAGAGKEAAGKHKHQHPPTAQQRQAPAGRP